MRSSVFPKWIGAGLLGLVLAAMLSSCTHR
jgi:hypothetical protein